MNILMIRYRPQGYLSQYLLLNSFIPRLQIVNAELTRFTESSPLVAFIALIATYA
jgi:hypothetical protein